MKFKIILFDTGIKKESCKALEKCLPEVQLIFGQFLKKSTQFSKVKLGSREVILNLTLCGKTKIQRINREFRKKDKPTDVLTFPLFASLRSDEIKKFKLDPMMFGPEVLLGDVLICKEVAKRQALEFDISYRDELLHLLCHGFLHVLGYDHERSAKEEIIMQQLEDMLVAELSKKFKRK
ncbi:MAG: rRNA maturation RNase YbeY [Bacteriovoracaceae bacterium]|nr:rRNA maturation RNase YbeY [Bacteriovoracaceae bacterium]